MFGAENPQQYQTVTSGHLELKTPNYEDFAVPHSADSEDPPGTVGGETIGSNVDKKKPMDTSPKRASAELRNYSTLSGGTGPPRYTTRPY